MVKLSENPYWQTPQTINAEQWLDQLPENYKNLPLIQQAVQLAYITGNHTPGLGGISCWQHGLSMADSLLGLNVDPELLAATLLYPIWQYADLNLDDISETLNNKKIAHLLSGTDKMEAVSVLHNAKHKSPAQIENCRKMLLAMVEDLRVVLLKLAERLHALRTAKFLTASQQHALGEEIITTYAPLANRLGLGQLKWEIEDLAFRAIKPELYKNIAKQLDMKRVEREALIKKTLTLLEDFLKNAGIHPFELMGRAKHLYSIHKKISRKNIDLSELFDISAVRVLVNSIEDCYRVLDIVQHHFEMIPQEFDDYISAPKANGYRSIHTAVYGPDRHIIEIQIRTFAMHQESELGVAAHWRYKEGSSSNQDYESKIAWLREILSWQNEIAAKEKPDENILADRVYVLTPNGDIIDLPQGATPLDFAYAIHTSIGHRCRGAKINGQIVTLTTPLKMGDRVDILTGKTLNPSRDWLNTNLGYLATARARAKVAHWFRQQDHDQNVADGKTILDRELKRLNLHDIEHESLAEKFSYDNKEAFYAALGANELRQVQLANRLEQWFKSAPAKPLPSTPINNNTNNQSSAGILIEGAANLLTHLARCCQPLPGDAIAGYISQKHSIAIHKITCSSFLARQKQRPERVLSASWGNKQQALPVTLIIEAEDRPNLTNEVIHLIAQEKLVLLGINELNHHAGNALEVYTRVNNLNELTHLIERLQQIPTVKQVYRK